MERHILRTYHIYLLNPALAGLGIETGGSASPVHV